MSQSITFSSLPDLHTKLWNNANNRWTRHENHDQKRKIYTRDPEGTIYEYLIFPETPSEEATNLKVEDMNGVLAEYGIPWDTITRGWIKVKALPGQVWWIYNPPDGLAQVAGSRGGRKKTRRKKCKRKNKSKRIDAGYYDKYRGWYDVQGCGKCYDIVDG